MRANRPGSRFHGRLGTTRLGISHYVALTLHRVATLAIREAGFEPTSLVVPSDVCYQITPHPVVPAITSRAIATDLSVTISNAGIDLPLQYVTL